MSDISAAVQAWDEWCDLLKRMGREVVAPPYPTDDGGDMEMLEHLADNVEAFLGWEVFHADPTRPFFKPPERPDRPVGRPQRRQRVSPRPH